jgi:hypothetical protein
VLKHYLLPAVLTSSALADTVPEVKINVTSLRIVATIPTKQINCAQDTSGNDLDLRIRNNHLSSTHVETHKLLQVCKQVVTNLSTSGVCAACFQLL